MAKSPKKTPSTPPANPYGPMIRFSYGSALKKKPKNTANTNTIQSVETGVPGIIIHFGTRPDKVCSYIWPFKNYHEQYAEIEDLIRKWGCNGFATRKLVTEDIDILDNVRMPGTPGQEDSYPWDAIVTVDNNATAASAGKKIAQEFTTFAAEKKNRGLFGNNKIVEFVFKGVLPEEEKGRPLTYYLMDDDSVRVFLLVFYDGTNKKELMKCGKLLKDFFGSMEIGLTLLEQYAKW